MRVYFETQYSMDGKKWFRFLDRHATRELAIAAARAKCNDEIETRVARVTVEVLDHFDKVQQRKPKPLVVPGLGVISHE